MRVLVVDDELRLAALIKRGLEEEGHAVDVVGDGSEAVWMATETAYDVVVLDVMLPGFDGFEVCRRLRQQAVWTPVLMLSARGQVDDRVRGLDCGADDYLGKPFTFAELGARLRALARRGSEPRPTTLTVGDLRLDPATRQAWRGDVELVLSAKEFSLLEFLMQHPGEVLTRTRILEHGWDFAFDGVSNVVDQYIRYLRNKIDRPFGRATSKPFVAPATACGPTVAADLCPSDCDWPCCLRSAPPRSSCWPDPSSPISSATGCSRPWTQLCNPAPT